MNKIGLSIIVKAILDFIVKMFAAFSFGYNLGEKDRKKLRAEVRELKLKAEILENEKSEHKLRNSMPDPDYIRARILARGDDD